MSTCPCFDAKPQPVSDEYGSYIDADEVAIWNAGRCPDRPCPCNDLPRYSPSWWNRLLGRE